jgi:hypothetical protein
VSASRTVSRHDSGRAVISRVPIKYSSTWAWLLTLCALPPRSAYIEVDGDVIRVRMGFAFRTRFTRGDVSTVEGRGSVVSVGVHGWSGRWLVNGANRPIARIVLALPAHAFVLGFRVRLSELLVSVDDVAALQRLLLT